MRYEITIKQYSDIDLIIKTLKAKNIKKISLTQKGTIINNIEVARLLKEKIPDLDISITFSIIHNYSKNNQEIKQRFLTLLEQAKKIKINKILLVSGSPRKLYSSTELLSDIKFIDTSSLKIYCAFNPFLTGPQGEDEYKRLMHKISTKKVSGIYIQLGDDLEKLRKGLNFLAVKAKELEINGSILIPNQSMLNKLKFRPWNGVRYSQKYINNLKFAQEKTKELQKIYKSRKIELLIISKSK